MIMYINISMIINAKFSLKNSRNLCTFYIINVIVLIALVWQWFLIFKFSTGLCRICTYKIKIYVHTYKKKGLNHKTKSDDIKWHGYIKCTLATNDQVSSYKTAYIIHRLDTLYLFINKILYTTAGRLTGMLLSHIRL